VSDKSVDEQIALAQAAMLLAAADAAGEEARQYYWSDDPDERHRDTIEDAVAKVVQALTSFDAAAALARRDAETRLDEVRTWHKWLETMAFHYRGVLPVTRWGKPDGADALTRNALIQDVMGKADERFNALTRQLDEAKAPKDAAQ
jgi:hypothetical protein